jgi:hypothetical protein
VCDGRHRTAWTYVSVVDAGPKQGKCHFGMVGLVCGVALCCFRGFLKQALLRAAQECHLHKGSYGGPSLLSAGETR